MIPCHGAHDLFYEPDGREPEPTRHAREAAALAICATCPLIGPCRADARATDAEHGYFGIRAGMTAQQRLDDDAGQG